MLTFCVFFKKPLNEVALMTPMKRSVTYCNHHTVSVVAAVGCRALLGLVCTNFALITVIWQKPAVNINIDTKACQTNANAAMQVASGHQVIYVNPMYLLNICSTAGLTAVQ